MIAIVQPRRIVGVVCAVLGIASLGLMWDSVLAAAAIDAAALALAAVGAVCLLPYLASGKDGAQSRIARLLAHIGVLLLAAGISFGVMFVIADTRTETLPWWVALPLVAVAIILAVAERRALAGRLAARPTESSPGS